MRDTHSQCNIHPMTSAAPTKAMITNHHITKRLASGRVTSLRLNAAAIPGRGPVGPSRLRRGCAGSKPESAPTNFVVWANA